MATDGYIKVWRRLFKHPIWLKSTPEQKCILMVLMEMANHAPKQWEWKGQSFTVERGQMVTSIGGIKQECGKGVSEQNVRTALARFEKLDFLTDEATKLGRLITITNYSKWQGDDVRINKDINRHLTKTSQRPNKDLTPNKNDKNDKNDKNVKNNIFRAPTREEVKAYCIERGNHVDADAFMDFYESKGWMVGKNKMKDWRAAVRNWERNSASKSAQQKQEGRLNWIDGIDI